MPDSSHAGFTGSDTLEAGLDAQSRGHRSSDVQTSKKETKRYGQMKSGGEHQCRRSTSLGNRDRVLDLGGQFTWPVGTPNGMAFKWDHKCWCKNRTSRERVLVSVGCSWQLPAPPGEESEVICHSWIEWVPGTRIRIKLRVLPPIPFEVNALRSARRHSLPDAYRSDKAGLTQDDQQAIQQWSVAVLLKMFSDMPSDRYPAGMPLRWLLLKRYLTFSFIHQLESDGGRWGLSLGHPCRCAPNVCAG